MSATDAPPARRSIRTVVLNHFPFLDNFLVAAGAKGRGLVIKAAGGILHLMGGPDDPAVHRVNDEEAPGFFSLGGPGIVIYVDGFGIGQWTMTLTSASPGSPVGVVLTGLPGATVDPGVFRSRASKGSAVVTCGGDSE